jgi:AcrR family transcriptional regulator
MARVTQDRALRTRETILHAAAEVLDEYGFAGSSITKIAERAGSTTGAIYFHFKSKEGLALAVMNAQPGTIVPRLTSEGLQRLVDITLVWCWRLQVDPLLRAGVRLTNEQNSFGVNDATPYRLWAEIMEECLEDARAKGQLRACVDSRRVAEFVVAACTGLQMYSHVVSRRSDLRERVVEMWELLLPGIVVEGCTQAIDMSVEWVKKLEV